MKKLASIMLVALMSANNVISAEPVFKDMGDSKYSIQVGDISMTVNAAAGAKILSFKYKDSEVISQSPMREAFGSTFWTSPQKEWNWPPVQEYDKAAYSVEQTASSLVMTGQASQRYKYRIRKEFKADKKGNAIEITYSIINESEETRSVAPWEITRVNNEGTIFFDAPKEAITPADLMPFTQENGASWYKTDVANGNRKINADGKGWLAYYGNNLLLVKKFPDLSASQPAPDEAEIQVYVNSGKTYIELESQGAYQQLKPGESLSYTVKWYLVPVDSEKNSSSEMMSVVKKLIK